MTNPGVPSSTTPAAPVTQPGHFCAKRRAGGICGIPLRPSWLAGYLDHAEEPRFRHYPEPLKEPK